MSSASPADLAWPARVLATLMSQVDAAGDDGRPLDEALIAAFNDSNVDLQVRTDRRQLSARHLKGRIAEMKAYRDEVDDYIAKLERIGERFKADAMAAVDALPAGVELRGTSGRKVYVRSNAASLTLNPESLSASKTISNVIMPEAAVMFGIEPRFLKTVSCLALDTAAIKTALAGGEQLPWAKLERSRSVVGLFPPDPKDAVEVAG